MPRQLGDSSSLEGLKKEAKRWLKELRAGDVEARRRFDRAHPRVAGTPALREVQHALAREHGLESWAALRAALDDLALARRGHDERVADFLELACLRYGVAPGTRAYTGAPDGPELRHRAARILERHPEVGRASLHAAVVCGDTDEVRRRLSAHPAGVNEKGGRRGWEPLLFLCYGRLPTAPAAANAVAIATLLLDHGADPDAQWTYDWEQRSMAWSALCGAIGDGEGGPVNCPPHPRAQELAALLLDRGASPNQGQALYNTMLRGDDPHWLGVLIARGLGPRDPIPWDADAGTTLFEYLLGHAVERNQLRRAAVLLEHGANPTPAQGRSWYERALLAGSPEMATLLAQHGAKRSELTGPDAFRSACLRGDRPAAQEMLAEHPELAAEMNAAMVEAAKRDLVEVARLLLDLGCSPDAAVSGPHGGYGALHQAACVNTTAVAELLLARGADADARDEVHRSTPLGWALYTTMPATIALFARHTRDVFTLAAGAQLEPLRALLARDPTLANTTTDSRLGLGKASVEPGETALFALPGGEEEAVTVAEILLAFGADPRRRNRAGQTAADKARSRGLDDAADVLAAAQEAP
jgi:ankyrin repeat protein